MNRIIKAVKKRIRQYPFLYPSKNKDALRWGIIGLGHMAEVFATALDEDKGCCIVGVASRSYAKAKDFATRHGRAEAFGSYESLLNKQNLDIDVIYIATPAKYHAQHIRLCLEAGYNVLCEKPITLDPEELNALVLLAEKKNLFLMEGMWMKCLPTFTKAYEWLNDGCIGKLELIKIDFYKREHINPNMAIFNPLEGGGVLHDFGVYAIAFLSSFLGGEPEVIRSEHQKSTFLIDADWQIYAERAGVKAFVNLSSRFNGTSKAALIGSDGVIEWDSQFNRSNRITLYDKNGYEKEVYSANYKNDGYEFEIAEVKDCLLTHKLQSVKISLNDSLLTLKIVDKLTMK